MSEDCKWPNGTCACYIEEQAKPDPLGRVWMHCDEGLSFSKASMSRFMMFCLRNKVEIGSVDAFNPKYPQCSVSASIRIKPKQVEAFENEVRAKLKTPAKLILS